jgi:outer membrane lipoprotein LolB
MGRLTAVLLLALALGACATPPTVSSIEMRAPLADNWTLQGRIGIRTEDQSLSGNFSWQHHAGMDDLLMTSPLGQGVAHITSDASGVTLEVPNQPPHRAPDAESLTRQVLGYALPVSGLAWWVQAHPAPGSVSVIKRDAAGRIAQLRQDGWVIDYLQYADDAAARPRKLLVAREGLEIRLVADSWKVE